MTTIRKDDYLSLHSPTRHTCISPNTYTTRIGEGNKALLSPNQESDSDEEGQEKKPGDQAQDKEEKEKKDDRPSDNTAEVGTVYHFHKLMNNIQ